MGLILFGFGVIGLAIVVGGLWLQAFPFMMVPATGTQSIGDYSNWGQFYGGFIGPLLTFITFIAVLLTIHFQRRDQEANEESAKLRAFEANFFGMLTIHNEIVAGLSLPGGTSGDFEGRRAFNAMYNSFRNAYNQHSELDVQERVRRAYQDEWARHRQRVSHYYRSLYNFCRYVDEADLPQGDGDRTRVQFMKILRSHLSDFELIMLCFSSYSDRGLASQRYIKKYDLLDNYPEDFIVTSDLAETNFLFKKLQPNG